jgi:hypothetical protein
MEKFNVDIEAWEKLNPMIKINKDVIENLKKLQEINSNRI